VTLKQQQLQEDNNNFYYYDSHIYKETKLCLNQRKRELDLERKIARAQAKEQTYANAELGTANAKRPS